MLEASTDTQNRPLIDTPKSSILLAAEKTPIKDSSFIAGFSPEAAGAGVADRFVRSSLTYYTLENSIQPGKASGDALPIAKARNCGILPEAAKAKWKSRLKVLNKMKSFLPFVLLIAGAELMQASTIESISFNLSALHAGSTLSGTFTLSNSPMIGDTAPVLLSFSDPSDYGPTSLASTITITNGTPSGFAVLFSELTFTNLSGATIPIDTKDVDLTGFAFAKCASFPCTASGGFQDRTPAVFTSTYTIAPAAVPEPSFALLAPILLIGIVFGRRLVPTV